VTAPSAPADPFGAPLCGACGRRLLDLRQHSPSGAFIAACSLHGLFVAVLVVDPRTGSRIASPLASPADPGRPTPPACSACGDQRWVDGQPCAACAIQLRGGGPF